jgi:hypothetical protein
VNEEQQRIAIAEACGWLVNEDGVNGISPINVEQGLTNPIICSWIIPDYLNDLNAMHEAEKSLDQMQARVYSDFLGQSEQDGTWAGCHCFHQTAAQRAEAFLKTIGGWKE